MAGIKEVMQDVFKKFLSDMGGVEEQANQIAELYLGKDVAGARQIFNLLAVQSSLGEKEEKKQRENKADNQGENQRDNQKSIIRSRLPDQEFYINTPEEVAKGLLGSMLVRINGKETFYGLVTKTRAFPEIKYADREDQIRGYKQAPGQIYLFHSKRGQVFAITAHKGNKEELAGQNQGVISLAEILIGKNKISMTKIRDKFEIENEFDGKYVNSDKLYIARANFDLEKTGFNVNTKYGTPEDAWNIEYHLLF